MVYFAWHAGGLWRLSALWALFGWTLPSDAGGVMVCYYSRDLAEGFFLRRYQFLRDTGLLHCPLLVIGTGISEQERQALEHKCAGIEICSLQELPARLELERREID